MFTIIFWVNYDCAKIITDINGMKVLANILERDKIKFQVWMVAGGQISQDQFGFGGFEFWMPIGENFVF